MRPILIPTVAFAAAGAYSFSKAHAPVSESAILLFLLWLSLWLSPVIASRLTSHPKRILLTCLVAIFALCVADSLSWLTVGKQTRFGFLRNFPIQFIATAVAITLGSLLVTHLSRALTFRSTRTQQPRATSKSSPHDSFASFPLAPFTGCWSG